jgi:hypothetical protein
MQEHNSNFSSPRPAPWNRGKLIGAKPPLRPKHIWSIRTKLQVEGRKRDLALFNLAIDSKLRGCDLVSKGRRCGTTRICCRSSDGAPEEDRPSGQVRVD